MKILFLLFISNITKHSRADTAPGNPFFTTIKISNMKKNQNKERPTHKHNVGGPISDVKNKNFDIFNNNYILFKTCLFSNFLTNSKRTSIIPQVFNDKIKFPVSFFSINQNKSFIARMLIENSISKQTLNRCYGCISLIQCKFLGFSLMRNDKGDRPFKFNVIVHLTAVFSMTLVVYINFFQKRHVTAQKLFLTKYVLKTSEKKKHKNVLIFVIFFVNSFQIFYDGNSTLTIINSNDFNDIEQYKDITKFIIISEGIYTIPSNSFSGWTTVISVNFGKSVSDIGGSVFSLCLSLENIIFGENVSTIGGSAFSICSSIKNVTIPNSVTMIGGYAFSSCSNLRILTLGYGIREIGNSAFGNCYSLECIYYYGETEPDIGINAFLNVTTTVITYPTYKDNTFAGLPVVSGSIEGNCNPIPTNSFSSSHTFSRSDTFTKSNTFTESFQSDLTFSYSYTLTYTLTITYLFTYYETQTRSLSLSIVNSTFSYIETKFIYYDYTVIIYSTHFNYYSNFITMFHTNILQTNGLTTNVLIGIVCGSIAFILIIVGIVTFLIKSNNKKEKSISKLQFKDTTTSSTKQIEEVNSLVEDIVKEDEDNWL